MGQSSSPISGEYLFKTGLFAVLAAVAYFLFGLGGAPTEPEKDNGPIINERPPKKTASSSSSGRTTLPAEVFPKGSGEVVKHTYFVLGYSEEHEQAEWVLHEITRERLNSNWAARPGTFRPDPQVRTESAGPRDYIGTGFDRGHLCPAADMAFDETAIDESFFMSNMSPQQPAFNAGIWRELEENCRDWGRRFGHLYVVTGPVLTTEPLSEPLGENEVTVPASFYKIVLAPEQHRAIAFIIPNAVSTTPVMDFACTIDQVEEVTGIDFFPKYLKGLDEELEASLDVAAWPVNRQRYERRVRQWNSIDQ